jgi:hypothetical protein
MTSAELLMAEPNAFEVETDIEKVKSHKSSSIYQISTEVFNEWWKQKNLKILRNTFWPLKNEVKWSREVHYVVLNPYPANVENMVSS